MKHSLALTVLLVVTPWYLGCNATGQHTSEPPDTSAAEHASYRPDQMKWKSGPESLPAGAQFVVLEGDPHKDEYFAMRLRLPDGYRIPPHWHPNVERVTVISGTLNLGMGDSFDSRATEELPAGSYAFMHPGMRHFAWAKGDTVIQLTTIGPWAINYVNPQDDPRKVNAQPR